MSILDIVLYPDPRLHEKCEPVVEFDDKLATLLDNMAETMYEANGIGLAAPQIGVMRRITVIDVSRDENGLLEFINPEIIQAEGSVTSEEGCLSIPDYRDNVKRNEEIVVKALNRKGQEFELSATELLAICLQHEIDHLDGVLFVDRLSRLKRDLFKRWFKKQQRLSEDE